MMLVSGTRSFDAKDREHTALGRSPGFWLQTRPILPSHPRVDSGFSSGREEMGCSPVTVARLHRICTDFPVVPETQDLGHLVRTL